jgi:hypothetical protein
MHKNLLDEKFKLQKLNYIKMHFRSVEDESNHLGVMSSGNKHKKVFNTHISHPSALLKRKRRNIFGIRKKEKV